MVKIVILENVRSAHNVGAIFRTADGAGVEKVYLCGYTPSPVDRFGRTMPEIEKTSLGATKTVPWESIEEVTDAIDRCKRDGYTVVAVEQVPEAVSIYEFSVPERVAYVFGHEVDGVSRSALKGCDAVVEIPMQGAKESLNVSVTAGIILFHR